MEMPYHARCGLIKLRMRENMGMRVKELLLRMLLIPLAIPKLMPELLGTANKGYCIGSLHRYAFYIRRYLAHVHKRYVRSCSR